MQGILKTIHSVNSASGMDSASAWESYKESKRDDLDLISGVQLIDSHARLFILEGHRADGSNGMARLGGVLERKEANSSEAFTLMDTNIVFDER